LNEQRGLADALIRAALNLRDFDKIRELAEKHRDVYDAAVKQNSDMKKDRKKCRRRMGIVLGIIAIELAGLVFFMMR
jgi:hypothetical protein